jgi:hypothetical protein
MVLALWFIVKGFDRAALDQLEPYAGEGTASPGAPADRTLVDSGIS